MKPEKFYGYIWERPHAPYHRVFHAVDKPGAETALCGKWMPPNWTRSHYVGDRERLEAQDGCIRCLRKSENQRWKNVRAYRKAARK